MCSNVKKLYINLNKCDLNIYNEHDILNNITCLMKLQYLNIVNVPSINVDVLKSLNYLKILLLNNSKISINLINNKIKMNSVSELYILSNDISNNNINIKQNEIYDTMTNLNKYQLI